MTIFRFSALLAVILLGACGLITFNPRNDLERLLQGDVDNVIASLEHYISEHENQPAKLEADLLEAGFKKGEFLADASEFEEKRKNCQFYRYRRAGGITGFGASAVVWLCDEGSGANFGYIAP